MKKNINNWLSEYNKYHKNKINKLIHWICVPAIMLSLFGLLSTLNFNIGNYQANVLNIFVIFSLLFYLRLSISLTIGMLSISIIFIFLINNINHLLNNSIYYYIAIFIIAWIGQFIGHQIEGKKPAFFKDLQFLLIGPLWLLSFIYKKVNIKI
tara:strand:- start:3 stop:461 length:459 start_codon:yes stop_codon:yes gene_type:complete